MNKESFKRNIRILRRKKWPVAIAIILIVAVILAPITVKTYQTHKRFSPKHATKLSSIILVTADREKTQLIGHRGFSSQAPENTVESIKTAGKYGFDSVEFDVRMTKDGVWVLCHDSDVKAVTDKKGSVSSYTYYDLVTCNIDKGANCEQFENLKIPTFEQALKACLECNLKPVIDIKDYTEDGLKTLLDTIEKYGFTESCSVASADRKPIELIHKINPEINGYICVERLSKKEINNCTKNPQIGLCFDAEKNLKQENEIEKLLKSDVPLICSNINDGETMKKYYKLGITDFISDTIYSQ